MALPGLSPSKPGNMVLPLSPTSESHPAEPLQGSTASERVGSASTGARRVRIAARSQSNDGPTYGECRHCAFEGTVLQGVLEVHADRRIRAAPMRPVCPGSGEAPVTVLDAADGSDLLEA